MTKLEIKKLDVKSVFKVVLYFSLIPVLIVFIGFLISGIFIGSLEFIAIIPILIYPFFLGLIGMVTALIYNWFSKKFGGLRIEVADLEHKTTE